MRRSGSFSQAAGEITVGRPGPAASRLGETVLGSFKLVEIIGRGSFATAFLADQIGTERRAVVKITHPELVDGKSRRVAQRRFEDEFRALTRVRHPNLVTVFLAGETDDGLPAIAMEHVDGNTMGEVLECTPKSLPIETLEPCFGQLGSALQALHSAGIVHRDIAPSNIIVGIDGLGRPQATLLDLGVAQLHDRALTSPHAVGTPRYVAPEQMLGNATSASDMFALGAVLWWALTGTELSDEVTRLGLDSAWGEKMDWKPDPRTERPDLPPRLSEFSARLLSFSAQARPSAEEFVAQWPTLMRELANPHGTAVPQAAPPPPEETLPPLPASRSGLEFGSELLYGTFEDSKAVRVTPTTRALRAVVVDDNAFTRRFIESYLAQHNVEVTLVTDRALLREAVQGTADAEARGRPDVVLVSGHLAGAEGCEVVWEVKSYAPALPVILTAQTELGDRWRICGARELVVVPSNLPRLGQLLEEVRATAAPDPVEPADGDDDFSIVRTIAAQEPRLMRDTIEDFVGQFPEWLAQLSSAVDRNDVAGCIATCRAIESAVVMVGATSLGRRASTIRSFAEEGEIGMVDGFIEQLEADYARAFPHLLSLLSEIEGQP